mmetsp:Transcript_24970/g.78196  ORF Transcript_24970/g.78196 Transcript_24970/m.78196 type:complete len:279 (+) Transcript_24970:731-1567(+)
MRSFFCDSRSTMASICASISACCAPAPFFAHCSPIASYRAMRFLKASARSFSCFSRRALYSSMSRASCSASNSRCTTRACCCWRMSFWTCIICASVRSFSRLRRSSSAASLARTRARFAASSSRSSRCSSSRRRLSSAICRSRHRRSSWYFWMTACFFFSSRTRHTSTSRICISWNRAASFRSRSRASRWSRICSSRWSRSACRCRRAVSCCCSRFFSALTSSTASITDHGSACSRSRFITGAVVVGSSSTGAGLTEPSAAGSLEVLSSGMGSLLMML